MRILVDADACPVKEEIIEVGLNYQVEVIFVTTTDHFSNSMPNYCHVRIIYIDPGHDSVDYHLLSLTKPGDIVVTQDYGLASLLITNHKVLHHSGREYNQNNMDQLLLERHMGQQLRKAGKRTKGPSRFTKADRQRFKKRLVEVINASEQRSSI